MHCEYFVVPQPRLMAQVKQIMSPAGRLQRVLGRPSRAGGGQWLWRTLFGSRVLVACAVSTYCVGWGYQGSRSQYILYAAKTYRTGWSHVLLYQGPAL